MIQPSNLDDALHRLIEWWPERSEKGGEDEVM